MFKLKRWGRILLPVLMATASGITQAELIEYRFTAPDGTKRALPANQVYANPKGNITFALSGGIDRKVRIALLQANGQEIRSATSHLLGALDRITVGGREYYGAELQLAAPGEGTYKLRADILAADGSSVQADTYDLVVDTTPPTISGQIARTEYNWPVEVLTNRTYAAATGLRVEGIADSSSGVESATFFTVGPDKQRREAKALIDPETGVASIVTANAVSPEMAPQDRSSYRIGFAVSDKAGNIREVSRTS